MLYLLSVVMARPFMLTNLNQSGELAKELSGLFTL
jgi:hypothetical protein